MIAINLLILVVHQAHGKTSMDKVVGDMADNLFDRALNEFSLQRAGLERSMLKKPGHLTRIPRSSHLGDLSAPLARYQSQSRQAVVRASPQDRGQDSSTSEKPLMNPNRRSALVGLASVGGSALLPKETQAIQGYVAGRVPGVAASDVPGFLRYTRPLAKQGGHGVGWSEIPPYTFLVPDGWEETPVSIADLGGTELDLRFKNFDNVNLQGDLAVVVAPVLRFADVGFGADVRITDIGPPDRLIAGFSTEITGGPIQEEQIDKMETKVIDGITYYNYQLVGPNPYGRLKFDNMLVSMSALKNRVFILAVRPKNGKVYEEYEKDFQMMADSFRTGVAA